MSQERTLALGTSFYFVFHIFLTHLECRRKHILPLTPRPKGILDKKSLRHFFSSLFWPVALMNADFRQIIRYNGLDAYFFVRYLRMMIKIFVPIWIISWAILLPVTTVGTGAPDQDSLTKFTFGNVGKTHQVRYWAHLACVWVFTCTYFSRCVTKTRGSNGGVQFTSCTSFAKK